MSHLKIKIGDMCSVILFMKRKPVKFFYLCDLPAIFKLKSQNILLCFFLPLSFNTVLDLIQFFLICLFFV